MFNIFIKKKIRFKGTFLNRTGNTLIEVYLKLRGQSLSVNFVLGDGYQWYCLYSVYYTEFSQYTLCSHNMSTCIQQIKGNQVLLGVYIFNPPPHFFMSEEIKCIKKGKGLVLKRGGGQFFNDIYIYIFVGYLAGIEYSVTLKKIGIERRHIRLVKFRLSIPQFQGSDY